MVECGHYQRFARYTIPLAVPSSCWADEEKWSCGESRWLLSQTCFSKLIDDPLPKKVTSSVSVKWRKDHILVFLPPSLLAYRNPKAALEEMQLTVILKACHQRAVPKPSCIQTLHVGEDRIKCQIRFEGALGGGRAVSSPSGRFVQLQSANLQWEKWMSKLLGGIMEKPQAMSWQNQLTGYFNQHVNGLKQIPT